jgi:peptidoglycan-associated lipoprotein
MKQKILLTLVMLLGLGLAGCGGSEATKPDAGAQDKGAAGAESTGAGKEGGAQVTPLEGAKAGSAEMLSKRRIYFAFDSSSIDEESRAVIEAHAAYLSANTSVKVTLEGHTDERGTREYNLALGDRRAKAVERMLRTLGVAADRIKTVSYGEEKPVALDHNESAWHLNRRVEIMY